MLWRIGAGVLVAVICAAVAVTQPMIVQREPAPPAANPSLPTFTFRELTAGVDVNPNTTNRCALQRDASRTCFKMSDHVGGVLADVMTTYFEDRLSGLYIDIADRDYAQLKSAFLQKYGQPCAKDTQSKQNRMGAHFDGEVLTWCFSSGKLVLEEVGRKVDRSRAVYTDVRSAPAVKGVVDF